MWKKIVFLALAMMLCACAALAEQAEFCWSADFDGDGAEEQFIIVGEDRALYISGNLMYVDGDETEVIMGGAGFLPEECAVWPMEDRVLFKVEESYGIGGSTSYVYYVENGSVERANGLFRSLTQVEDNCFRYWQQDTDRNSDRSGVTLKPYYVHWTDGFFFEMGGIYVSEEEVAAWPEGRRALEYIYDNGFMVKTLLYRENGILNISYSDNLVNGNITMLYQDEELFIIGTDFLPTDRPYESDFGGTFQTMTGNSRYVTFPETGFPQPAE